MKTPLFPAERATNTINCAARVSILVVLAALPFARPADATPIIDTNNALDTNASACCGPGFGVIYDDTFTFLEQIIAQSFTVVNTGILTGIDLWGTAQAPQYVGLMFVSVFSLEPSGAPPTDFSSPLGIVSQIIGYYSESQLSEFNGFSIPVTAGDQLAFVVSAEERPGLTTAFMVVSPLNREYAGGMGFVKDDIDSSTGLPNPLEGWEGLSSDFAFRTKVECTTTQCVEALPPLPPPPPPLPVPEPMSLTLVFTGLVITAARYQRR
jgi:hypothetical protein